MAAWSDGYFTDVQYTAKFFAHTAPGAMAFACLRRGVRPPALGPGSTYLELGCGQGFNLNLLAAANPHMRFVGLDFHPGQIANAQRLADAAGLTNITFDDLSFAQALDLPEGRIPRCDIIALHGVLSWVSPENRALIVQILDRHLKPGGMVSASYNAFPGWDTLMPMRRFVKGHFDRGAGAPKDRAVAAFRAARDMAERGLRHFASPPQAKAAIERALAAEPAYLIHEYFNDHFHPLAHAEVVREFEAARLSFVASAAISEDLPALAAPQSLQADIQAAADPVWRETLLDFAIDRKFRRDIFVRGPTALPPRELEAALHAVRLTLTRPAGQVVYEFKAPIGDVKGDPVVYGAVIQALAEGPRTYGDLAALPVFAQAAESVLMKVVGLHIEAGAIHPALDPEIVAPGPAQAFNRTLLNRGLVDDPPRHLAIPAAGTGLYVTFSDALALSAAHDKKPDHAATARRGWAMLARTGARLQKDGVTLSGQEAHEAELTRRLELFATESLPLYRALDVV